MTQFHKDSEGYTKDLDDEATYGPDHWFPQHYNDLDAEGMHKALTTAVGYSLFYMLCWNPDWLKLADGGQYKRVLAFGRDLCERIKENPDLRKDRTWLRKQLYLILDETENQC